MTITTLATAGVAALNGANPNNIPDEFRQMLLGSFVRAMPIPLRNQVPLVAGANPYVLATLGAITLPDDAKANTIFRAYARTGTGTTGELALKSAIGNGSPYTTPTAGTVGVAPSGDIVFLGTDAWTNVDVLYLPEKYDVVELNLPVASNVMTLPTSVTTQGVVFMLEAQATAGTTIGTKVVLAPSASAPGSTGQANLNILKTQVLFTVADAVTAARVKLGLCNATDLNAFLETAQNFMP
jgi:hypothetical protein